MDPSPWQEKRARRKTTVTGTRRRQKRGRKARRFLEVSLKLIGRKSKTRQARETPASRFIGKSRAEARGKPRKIAVTRIHHRKKRKRKARRFLKYGGRKAEKPGNLREYLPPEPPEKGRIFGNAKLFPPFQKLFPRKTCISHSDAV